MPFSKLFLWVAAPALPERNSENGGFSDWRSVKNRTERCADPYALRIRARA
jgi:hypothetical protein